MPLQLNLRMFLKFLTVAGLATFEIYAAIPAGFAFGLSPWVIFFASVVGGIVGVYRVCGVKCNFKLSYKC